jgi:tetratricopeptide (TPR) repeat protein
MGIAHVRLEQYQEAVQDFSKAIEIFPDFAAAYMSRSGATQELGDYKKSKQDYETAIAIINAVNSGEDYGALNSEYSTDSTYLQKLIEFEADFNSNNVAGGRIQNQRILIQLLPNFSIQYIDTKILIEMQRQRGYYYKPLENITRNTNKFAFGLSSSQHDLSLKTALRMAEITDSITYFDPFNAENYFVDGTFNAMMRNYNEASTAFNRAIELDPSYLAALFNRANIQFELIEHQFALEQSRPQITITQNPVDKIQEQTTTKIPDFSSVIDDYTRVLQIDPSMSFAYYNRGNIKNRMRDFKGAIQDYTAALSINPDFAEAYYNRALTLIYMKRTKDACYDLSKAGELGVQDAYNVIKRYCNK